MTKNSSESAASSGQNNQHVTATTVVAIADDEQHHVAIAGRSVAAGPACYLLATCGIVYSFVMLVIWEPFSFGVNLGLGLSVFVNSVLLFAAARNDHSQVQTLFIASIVNVSFAICGSGYALVQMGRSIDVLFPFMALIMIALEVVGIMVLKAQTDLLVEIEVGATGTPLMGSKEGTKKAASKTGPSHGSRPLSAAEQGPEDEYDDDWEYEYEEEEVEEEVPV